MSDLNVLSQEEINSLLNVSDNLDQVSASIQSCPSKFLFKKTFQGASYLDSIHLSFCSAFKSLATCQFNKEPVIECNQSDVSSIEDYTLNSARPVLTCVVNMKPIHGTFLIILSHALINNLIEIFFGGSNFEQSRKIQKLGSIENFISKIFIEVLIKALNQSWKNKIHSIEIEYLKMVNSPLLVNEIKTSADAYISRFHYYFDHIANELTIIYPQTTLQSIKKIFDELSSVDKSEKDIEWQHLLFDSFLKTPLNLTAETGQITMKLADLSNIKEGDIVPIENPSDAIIKINHKPAFIGKCIKQGNKRMISITRKFDW